MRNCRVFTTKKPGRHFCRQHDIPVELTVEVPTRNASQPQQGDMKRIHGQAGRRRFVLERIGRPKCIPILFPLGCISIFPFQISSPQLSERSGRASLPKFPKTPLFWRFDYTFLAPISFSFPYSHFSSETTKVHFSNHKAAVFRHESKRLLEESLQTFLETRSEPPRRNGLRKFS